MNFGPENFNPKIENFEIKRKVENLKKAKELLEELYNIPNEDEKGKGPLWWRLKYHLEFIDRAINHFDPNKIKNEREEGADIDEGISSVEVAYFSIAGQFSRKGNDIGFAKVIGATFNMREMPRVQEFYEGKSEDIEESKRMEEMKEAFQNVFREHGFLLPYIKPGDHFLSHSEEVQKLFTSKLCADGGKVVDDTILSVHVTPLSYAGKTESGEEFEELLSEGEVLLKGRLKA